jgi:hypothetical protein
LFTSAVPYYEEEKAAEELRGGASIPCPIP